VRGLDWGCGALGIYRSQLKHKRSLTKTKKTPNLMNFKNDRNTYEINGLTVSEAKLLIFMEFIR